MVVCYEQASGERDALLARALNPYTEGSNVLPMAPSPPRAAHVARRTSSAGPVPDLLPLTSTNDRKGSRGETRTLNLAVRFE